MELEDLKDGWNSVVLQPKTANELRLMLKENKHPILKRIRRKIIIETVGWSAFLLCYYTMFDGDTKPLIANIILIVSILAALLHNIAGYDFSKNLVADADIKTAMQVYIKKMKHHVIVNILLRVIFISGLLTFFCWNVTMDLRRYLLLGAGIALLIAQLVMLNNIWAERIRSLSRSITVLGE
jgi:hypothetical protein